MASKLLRGLAVAAGTGLAIGFGFVYLGTGKRRRKATRTDTAPSDSILLIEPILDRLDRIESRVSAMESRPIPLAESASLAELDLRIRRQTDDIETLQTRINETRQGTGWESSLVERRFAELAREDPAILESMLDTTLSLRVEDLRIRLHAEILESVEATLTRFERTIDGRVSARISMIEKALTEQSAMIASLSQRELESDAHLRRLILAVERLCERADAHSAPMPAKEPSFLDLPFKRHIDEAREVQPEPVAHR